MVRSAVTQNSVVSGAGAVVQVCSYAVKCRQWYRCRRAGLYYAVLSWMCPYAWGAAVCQKFELSVIR